MSARPTVVFAGGGTGGHIFPAIAIAQHLEPDLRAQTVFVCSVKPLDAKIIADAGHEALPIPAQPFLLGPSGLIRFARAWGGTVRTARALLRERAGSGPVVVVAMGGFVAPPVAQAARVQGVPIVLVNLDATPGKANRWIARFADRVVTATPIDGRPWALIGPIVRREAIAPGDARACRLVLGLEPDRPTLFVTGASQGARSLNLFMARFATVHADALAGWQVLHQAGTMGGDVEAIEAYRASGIPARVVEFIDPMGPAWGAADVVVSRAGAGSVAEAWANAVPAILVPYPGHRDEHQGANAQRAVEAGAARLVRDHQDAVKNLDSIGGVLRDVLGDEDARASMRRAWGSLGGVDGAARAAGVIADLLTSR